MSGTQGKTKHRSMRGTYVDMDAMRVSNETTIAMGNSNMNARGDILDSNGNVSIRREQIIQAYNKQNIQGVKRVSLKETLPDQFETPQQAVERLTREMKPEDGKDELSDVTAKKSARKLLDKTD